MDTSEFQGLTCQALWQQRTEAIVSLHMQHSRTDGMLDAAANPACHLVTAYSCGVCKIGVDQQSAVNTTLL